MFCNLKCFEQKKICAMVKCNAYGHGMKEIVQLVCDKVASFGVVNVQEALAVRSLTDKPVQICAKLSDGADLALCRQHAIDVIFDDLNSLQQCLDAGLRENLHLKINCGMNRFGAKSVEQLQVIDDVLRKENVSLKSICTHFSCTQERSRTKKQHKLFRLLRAQISQDAPISFGGSGVFDYHFDYDILRLGIAMYGYGFENTKKQLPLRPVMQVRSHVSKVFFAKKGEYIGYNRAFRAKKDGFFAVVPVGYGDGLRRSLAGKFFVKINNKLCRAVGNICMDCFFVEVDAGCFVGDEVEVFSDAHTLSAGTITYEVLTNFSNLRGETIIV